MLFAFKLLRWFWLIYSHDHFVFVLLWIKRVSFRIKSILLFFSILLKNTQKAFCWGINSINECPEINTFIKHYKSIPEIQSDIFSWITSDHSLSEYCQFNRWLHVISQIHTSTMSETKWFNCCIKKLFLTYYIILFFFLWNNNDFHFISVIKLNVVNDMVYLS